MGESRSSGRSGHGLRIVRIANFVTPTSGGLRTALRELGAGYSAAGHRPVLLVPGPRATEQETEQGTVITVPAHRVPGTGGYRVLLGRSELSRLLDRLGPDRLEVSDRSTLRWTGAWAAERGVPAVMVSHESLDGLLRTWGLPQATAERLADRHNARTAELFPRIVCTTSWAAAEFRRIGVPHLVRAPLGVDLTGRHPDHANAAVRTVLTGGADLPLLLLCSRLSTEKRPGLALDALAELRRRGVPAVLAVVGDGPLRRRLAARAARERLPVRLLGHLSNARQLAAVQAVADVTLAPGPVETFGLAALESLASGTPVVASRSSALPEVIGGAGLAARDDADGFADAVTQLLARPEAERRAAARARAERFPWSAAVAAFLAAHGAERPAPAHGAAAPHVRCGGNSCPGCAACAERAGRAKRAEQARGSAEWKAKTRDGAGEGTVRDGR